MVDRDRTLKGTDIVLVDLGFEDAEELTATASLALKLDELVEERGFNWSDVASITGMRGAHGGGHDGVKKCEQPFRTGLRYGCGPC